MPDSCIYTTPFTSISHQIPFHQTQKPPNHMTMENPADQSELIELPPGFRFHPTDEELIADYLLPKSTDVNFVAIAIGVADLKKLEPWQLPEKANMGEEEWYFFTLTERRYPTGERTNRGTNCGYWKATGKDKQIYRGRSLVGMRKTLVFYQGRAPKGVKSNWVMHEYRLDGINPKSDWVISRVFHKTQSGKKTHKSALPIPNSHPEDFNSLPPLISYSGVDTKSSLPGTSGVETDWSNFSDHPEYLDSYFNNESPISKFLIDDDGSGNDLLSSLKKEKWTDTASGSSSYGGGGGYVGGDENDNDRIDTNSYINF